MSRARPVLEHLLLGLVAAALGFGSSLWIPLGIPPSAGWPLLSHRPAGMGWGAGLVMFVASVVAGWRRGPAALAWVVLFGLGMVPITVHRLEFHHATPLVSTLHPYGTALVLVAPGIFGGLLGAGLGALIHTRAGRNPEAAVVAERRRRSANRLARVGVGLFILPFIVGVLEAALMALIGGEGLFFTTTAMMVSFPVGILFLALAAVYRRA